MLRSNLTIHSFVYRREQIQCAPVPVPRGTAHVTTDPFALKDRGFASAAPRTTSQYFRTSESARFALSHCVL